MATSKITWENKEGIQNDGSIARKNKVMDDDMNEIKQVVNNNADELNIAQSNIEDLQSGQSTSNADITSIKNRISTLETDNKTNKSDISALKSDNTTNKENISTLQEQVGNKVDKIAGKGLSTNDFTNEYKQKLEDLENYDDTEIKKDISDIKEEQETQNTSIEDLQKNDETQDELIEKLQQENENIKNALINVETEQAKSLHIEDASTVAGVLEVEGNAEQETREGYNLLNSSLFNLSEVSNYATFNKEDGTITFNGTVNADINIRSLRQQAINGTGKENIIIKILNGSLNGILRLVAQDTDYNNLVYTQIGTSSFTNKLTENIEYNIFSISITSGTVMNNLKLGFMIVDDSNLDKEYEQYGAMPSVNYPSKIKCLGSNKNELNIEEIESNSNTNVINNQNGILELQGIEGYYKGVYIEKQLKPKTTYTICANLTEVSNNARGRIGIGTEVSYNNASIATLDFDVATGKKEINFTTNETGIVYIMFVCNWAGNSGHVKYENIKLEEGTVATSYSPFGQGSTEIVHINSNFLNTENINKTVYGINIVSNADKSLKITEKATGSGYTTLFNKVDLPFTLKQGTKVYLNFGKGKQLLKDTNIKPFIWFYSEDNINTTNLNSTSYSGTVSKDTTQLTFGIENIESGKTYNENIFIVLSTEEVADYIEHEQTNDILNIQQEMFPGDCWTKEEDGWKEVHNWITIYNKDINKNIDNIEDEQHKTIITSINLPKKALNEKPFSNILIYENNWEDAEHMNLSANLNIIYCIYNKSNFSELTYETIKKTLEKIGGFIKYKSEEPTKLVCTEEQSAVLDKLNNLELFKGTNNIITTEDIALLKLNYIADTKIYVDNQIADMQNQLNTINELLSTTGTSSLLLDNLQSDLESEVM